EMYEKYMRRSGANTLLAEDALSWLAEHGAIRVGYLDDYLAFCDYDEESGRSAPSGALNGVLKDFLAYAVNCMANARLSFETTAYPTAAAAIDALNRGEVDCVFPVSLMACDGEVMDLSVTPPLLGTDIYAAALRADPQMFSRREHVIVAVGTGDLNVNTFLLDHFPDWRRIYYPSTDECLEAVADGVADCVLFSNYRHNNLARLLDSYRLTTLNTGAEMDCGFAVRGGETGLYSLLSKVIGTMPSSAVNTALSFYTSEDARFTLADFLRDNMPVVMTLTGVFLLIILTLMLKSVNSERKARKLISATETDELTGLYNRNFFFQYADRMHREHPDTPMDAIVVNIEQFHSVNALKGRPFGDQVLRALGGEIRVIARETKGIAGRFEADRFDIYCRHTREYQAIYDRLQAKLDALDANASLRLRMGVMPWQQNLEPEQLFDMAHTACSMARGHYKEHLIVFDEKVHDREIYEQRLLNDLRPALEEFQFEVYYQPKYDIQADPPHLVSAEALIRWRHP
ncbi:MAG: diguanylate cyclase domain-containing protein, partial [bacterium]